MTPRALQEENTCARRQYPTHRRPRKLQAICARTALVHDFCASRPTKLFFVSAVTLVPPWPFREAREVQHQSLAAGADHHTDVPAPAGFHVVGRVDVNYKIKILKSGFRGFANGFHRGGIEALLRPFRAAGFSVFTIVAAG